VIGVFDDHLSLDAIVAFADGEMSLTPYQRAAAHISRCAACAAEVGEQTAASQYLRQAHAPVMPGSLFDALNSIPVALPQAGPVPGVVVDSVSGRALSTGSSVSGRGRRFRLGAGALMAGLAVGAVVVAAGGEQPVDPIHLDRPNRPAVSSLLATQSPTTVRPTAVDVLARSTVSTGR